MKTIVDIIVFCLLLILASGCEKSTDQKINEHRKPIIVVSKGTVLSVCCMKFRDADGKYFSLVDNSLESLQVGDTLRGMDFINH